MITQVLSQYRYTVFSCIGLLLFVVVFAGAVLWAFRNKSTEVYSKLERIPFE